MQIDRRLVAHFDWTLFFLAVAFVSIGIATIYSANYNIAEDHAGGLPSRQMIWFGLGIVAMLTALAFDYHYIDRLAYPFYGAMLLLLILVLFIGHSGGGSQRWTMTSEGITTDSPISRASPAPKVGSLSHRLPSVSGSRRAT